jgi:hypothetical protein
MFWSSPDCADRLLGNADSGPNDTVAMTWPGRDSDHSLACSVKVENE